MSKLCLRRVIRSGCCATFEELVLLIVHRLFSLGCLFDEQLLLTLGRVPILRNAQGVVTLRYVTLKGSLRYIT